MRVGPWGLDNAGLRPGYSGTATSTAAYQTGLFTAEFLLFLSTGPINVVIVSAVPYSMRAMAMAVSIFVNPIQFDRPDDYAAYTIDAGKDVYSEKPMGNVLAEVKAARDAAECVRAQARRTAV